MKSSLLNVNNLVLPIREREVADTDTGDMSSWHTSRTLLRGKNRLS